MPCRPPPRRRGVCDRRHDLAFQVGRRRRLQGSRAAEATRKAIKRADQIAAYFEATELAGFSVTEAVRYFGRPRGIAAGRFDFTPRPVRSVEKAFLKRFEGIEALRAKSL